MCFGDTQGLGTAEEARMSSVDLLGNNIEKVTDRCKALLELAMDLRISPGGLIIKERERHGTRRWSILARGVSRPETVEESCEHDGNETRRGSCVDP